jgi:excisionase family DNA binding protein
MAESREVMNIREAAQYLGISADTLYKYVSEEKIPAFKLGNRWKFKKTILDAWMERQSTSVNASRNGNKKKPRTAQAFAAGE